MAFQLVRLLSIIILLISIFNRKISFAKIDILDESMTISKEIRMRQTNEDVYLRILKEKPAITTKQKNADRGGCISEAVFQSLADRISKLEAISTSSYKRTCHELLESGVTESGEYTIDPDGIGFGLPPIIVKCHFNNSIAETIVSHNSIQQTQVTPCANPGCFEHKLEYELPMDHIKSVISLSTSCKQEISYGCKNAPLFEYSNSKGGGINFGYWLDTFGEKQVYFAGSSYSETICQCYIDRNCEGPEYMNNTCNCNAGIPEWRIDSGVINNMSALPISQVNFGGLNHPSKQANVSIGPLICSGNKPQTDSSLYPPTSCGDIKLRGFTSNDFYTIVKNISNPTPQLTYCDLSKSGYDITGTDYPPYKESFNVNRKVTWVNRHSYENITTEDLGIKIFGFYLMVIDTKGNSNLNPKLTSSDGAEAFHDQHGSYMYFVYINANTTFKLGYPGRSHYSNHVISGTIKLSGTLLI